MHAFTEPVHVDTRHAEELMPPGEVGQLLAGIVTSQNPTDPVLWCVVFGSLPVTIRPIQGIQVWSKGTAQHAQLSQQQPR